MNGVVSVVRGSRPGDQEEPEPAAAPEQRDQPDAGDEPGRGGGVVRDDEDELQEHEGNAGEGEELDK